MGLAGSAKMSRKKKLPLNGVFTRTDEIHPPFYEMIVVVVVVVVVASSDKAIKYQI